VISKSQLFSANEGEGPSEAQQRQSQERPEKRRFFEHACWIRLGIRRLIFFVIKRGLLE